MSHMWPDAFASTGSYSVTGFYVISGYVITKVLNERYWRIENGFRKFWINRFLRLYPAYAACALLGLGAAILFPEASHALKVGLVLPNSALGEAYLTENGFDPGLSWVIWLTNITIAGIQSPFIWYMPIAFAPNAWSVSVEIYYYIILSLGAANLLNVRRFLYISILFVVILFILIISKNNGVIKYPDMLPYFRINDWMIFYKSFLGTTFFFAIGAYAYFIPKAGSRRWVRYAALAAAVLGPFVYVNTVGEMIAMRFVYGLVIAGNLILFADETRSRLLLFLGSLSYPMFLAHWPVAAYAGGLLGIEKNSALALAATYLATFVVSAAIVLLIERPIERLRARNRA